MSSPAPITLVASLRDALEAARGVRTQEELAAALDRIARVVSDSCGFGTCVVNVHRQAWDDFEAVTVHGSPEARRALLGTASTWEQWGPYLSPRFERR
ncbi:MAG: hypothetical protein HZB46_06185, partial [Solirubrobacterales bacterium]|nr:hypothetical protein [Solirubrobacterales bacterium]